MNHQKIFDRYFISNEDWSLYGPITTKIFDYMNGRVNIINKPAVLRLFQVNPCFDRLLGQHNVPNIVDIYLGNIILQYDDLNPYTKSYFEYRRHDFICSRIAFTICHELYHADQFLNLVYLEYTGCYFDKTEIEVEEMAFQWMNKHKSEIEELVGFKYIDDSNDYSDKRNSYPLIYTYERITLEQLLINHIDTIFNMERFEEYLNTGCITSLGDIIKNCDNCIISFARERYDNNPENVQIKRNGQYLQESLSSLSNLMERYITEFEDFKKDFEIEYTKGNNSIKILLAYYDYVVNPMVLREDMAQAYDKYNGEC